MFEYTVAAEFEHDAARETYVEWLTHGHLADVVKGGALEARLVRTGERSVVVHYLFADAAAFARYEAGPAVALRAEGAAKFPPGSGVRMSRSSGPVIASVTHG